LYKSFNKSLFSSKNGKYVAPNIFSLFLISPYASFSNNFIFCLKNAHLTTNTFKNLKIEYDESSYNFYTLTNKNFKTDFVFFNFFFLRYAFKDQMLRYKLNDALINKPATFITSNRLLLIFKNYEN